MAEEIRPRAAWDEYFMSIAQVVATRSTCPRKYVGSVLVKNRTILSTGYNGSIRGMPHCSDVGHMMEEGHCVATIHAEANAIIQAARNGVMIEGADYSRAGRRVFARACRRFGSRAAEGADWIWFRLPCRPCPSPNCPGRARPGTSTS